MAYCSSSDVCVLVPNIIGGASDFGASTSPTLAAVNAWLSTGCSIIESRLAAAGYDVPPASTAAGYAWLKHLNAIFGAAMAELSHTVSVLGPGESTRGMYLYNMFWRELDRLNAVDLTSAGLDRSSQGRLYVTGITLTDKETRDADTDRVRPRFRRGQFDWPGTIRPDLISSAS